MHIFLILTSWKSFSFQVSTSDCLGSVTVCGNTQLNLNSQGIGTDDFASAQSFAPSCNFFESQSLWLKVTAIEGGTLSFVIKPESNSSEEDYDFAIYGPNVSCDALGTSIRCSSSSPQNGRIPTLTGLRDSESDLFEGPGDQGNGFVKTLDVAANDVYYILIDNFSQNQGFSLEFTGTALFSEQPENQLDTDVSLDLFECDSLAPVTDGLTTFNLEVNTNNIIGTQLDTEVTYHATEADAATGANKLISPYQNTEINQLIYVRIEDKNSGCFITEKFKLSSSATAVIENINVADLSTNNKVDVFIKGVGTYEYALEIDGETQFFQDNPSFENVPVGTHRIIVREKNGCSEVVSEFFSVIGFPTYFTPNGDTFHETWNLSIPSDDENVNGFIYIFDRNGRLLKQITPASSGWDGTYQGKRMPSGQYWFKATLRSGRSISGNFSLIR